LWNKHAGLPDCGREHAFLDTKDWPALDSIHYNGAAYRFLSLLEGDIGKGRSTMLKVSNDLINYTKIECADLYGNATNKPLLQKNLWDIECLNVASCCVMAIDSTIHVMSIKDGMRYTRAVIQEIMLDGKQPWIVKGMQTIPAFPYYWGKAGLGVNRDKAGASWYGGIGNWPSCFVWIPEEKKAYCYWGEQNTIGLSVAHIVPEFRCASLSLDTAMVDPGSTVQVKATIWNYGDAAGDDTVNLFSDGTKVAVKLIHLAANTDSVIVFTLTAQTSGAHMFSIDNCKAALMVSGNVAISRSGEAGHLPFKAVQQYNIRIVNVMGRIVRSVQSDRDDLNPAALLKDCARGVYLVQVLNYFRIVKYRLVLK
jgi:hypothetical protein